MNPTNKGKLALKKIIDFVERIFEYFVMACSLVMVTTVVVNVLIRYFIKYSIVWSDELSRYMLVMITFIGGALALKRGQHAILDLILRKLPQNLHKVVSVLQHALTLIFVVLFTAWSFTLSTSSTVVYQHSPAMELPMVCVYGIMPIAFGYMSLVEINSLVNLISHKQP